METVFIYSFLVALITLHPAVVLSFLLHAHTEFLSSTMQLCLTHSGISISCFTVLVSLWGLKCFTVICYMWVPKKKKVSLYHWKRYCKNRKWLESDGNFCLINIQNFIMNQFTFYQNLIYVLQMHECIQLFCSPHTVLIKLNINFYWCR